VRRIAGRALVPAAIVVALGLVIPAGAGAAADPCAQLSPSAATCVFLQKVADGAAAECRRLGRPDSDCALPLSHRVSDAIRDAYLRSWVHRAAQFQYHLGEPLSLREALWLGTHNSFNSLSDSTTLSHSDSNQQLSLTQQLDIDVRGLELDLHWFPSASANGSNAVVVCHARGPDEANAGCTNERLFSEVLPEIAGWLNIPAHRDQVILLYLEDELGDPAGYAETISVLDRVLRRADGSSLLYRPGQTDMTGKGCANLPLAISRRDVLARGAQVLLVGNCRSGWSSDVFGWDDVHVESGSTPRYSAFPTCDATYSRSVYFHKLVRYYEDSTFIARAVDPTSSPQDAQADTLAPEKAAAMTHCGVNLFGFDQLLPDDGRIEASIWSWATDKPSAADGDCAAQRADGRWVTASCDARRRAACRTATAWTLTHAAVTYAGAPAACRARQATFALPRTGYDNSLLRQAAGAAEAWLAYRLSTDPGSAALTGASPLRLSLALGYRAGRSRNGRRCAAGDVTAKLGGRDRGRIRYADFSIGASGLGRDRSAPFSKRVQRSSLRAGGIYRVKARAKLRGDGTITLTRSFRACGR
jgi:hypothetical protein